MSFGEGDLHAKVAQLKTENGRLEAENRELIARLNEYESRANRCEIRVCFTDAGELEYLLPIAIIDREISHFDVDGVRYEAVVE